MSFDFVPRSLKKRKVEPSVSTTATIARKNVGPGEKTKKDFVNAEQPAAQKSSSKDHVALASTSNASITNMTSRSSKEPDLESLAALVCLALSDYALWADVDLRRRVDWSSVVQHPDDQNDGQAAGDDTLNEIGFVPLAYLFKHSSVFHQATASPSFHQHPETTYVKALRIHATETIDVRLTLSSEEPAFGQSTTGKWSKNHITQTGYEVRRRISNVAEEKKLSGHGKVDWDRHTIYVENVPIHYRSLPGTLKFILNILSSAPLSSNPDFRVQHIAFPPHHRDQPNSIPICKGFAIVTLASSEDVNYILEKWPWDSQTMKGSSKVDEVHCNHPEVLQDASKFGFRTLSKQGWDALKAEYLLFRQQLVEEINEFQEQEDTVRRHVSTAMLPSKADHKSNPIVHASSSQEPCEPHAVDTARDHAVAETSSSEPPKIHANSPYPSGCLVFVRHLHLETNKTTLRALFSQAWKKEGVQNSGNKPVDGIDYLDYMKGTDGCHIRLSTPLHAQQFVEYFFAHLKEQTSGLDGVGQVTDSSQKAIAAELVLGKREELYWQKVPEKIRRQAVDKAIKFMNAGGVEQDAEEHPENRPGTLKRKKR